MDFQSSRSSSSSKRIWKYDVHLSNYSLETHMFVKWLSNALQKEGLTTGWNWYDPLEIIEESQIYMVVFSQSYAESTNCLTELAIIFEWMKVPGHSFLPIFFEVDPSEVKRWLAPCNTLLNQRPDFVIQHGGDEKRVIGEIAVEAKKMLANERDTFPMDWQSSLLSPSSSSSSSKWIWPWSCDVFLSFSIEDTDSCSFVQLLSQTLIRNGFTAASCDSILRGPFEKYKIHVVIFSKNYIYASSTRYLQELATIAAKCINSSGHSTFLPIFFKVDPSEVRNSCFLKRIQELGLDLGKVVTLLAQCQNLVIWRDQRDQRRVIGEIVEQTMKILNPLDYRISSLRDIDQAAEAMDKSSQIATVGVRYHLVEKLLNLMELGSENVVRVVGICGMGGIGKTALAADVLNSISYRFDASCFLTDVSQYDSLMLQEVLLRVTLQEEYVHLVDNIRSSLRLHKMLIVLDDVDKLGKFMHWIRNRDWFGGGSRIIIISRDEHVLKLLGVDEIHKVELLNKDEAIQLFCKTVFKCGHLRGYEELTQNALKYANGLPLAIKSLASLLLNISVSEWQGLVAHLQMVPDSFVFMVLRKSLDGLSMMQKEIFLDIACCFTGNNIDYVKKILSSQYEFSFVEVTITVLLDKSLVNISHQKIEMHSLLQQMGKEIVRRESTELGKRSRIWSYEDFCHIMETYTGTKQIKVIVISNQECPQVTPLNVEGLSKMTDLKLLMLRDVIFSGSLSCLSNKLKYLSWHKYPFICLPPRFQPYQLVELILPDSYITQLWEEREICLRMLKSLDLCGSKYLNVTPDFNSLSNLERLDLEGCTSLLQLHPSIRALQMLRFLNLKNCTNLVSVPNDLFGQSSIELLNLAGCSKFAECLSFNKRAKTLPPILV